ncbi:MAG: aldo/keto reductase [Clostridia bacterium]|nr:aldo/keto reductase [Clostridia bacterium]
MRTIRLNGVGFPVSAVCLGTAYLGSREDDETSFAILDTYYEAGGRFFNTAHEYGDGKSERVIGKWLRARGISREDIVLTSKCGEDDSRPDVRAMHAEELLEDLDETLSRTGFDYVDFYLLHMDDVRIPVCEILSAMHEMQRCGRIRHYGCSNWSVARQKEAAEWAAAHGIEGFLLDEIEMNLTRLNVDNHAWHCNWLDGEYAAYHRETGMAVGAYSPIANGILTKYLRDGDTRAWRPHALKTYTTVYNFEAARRIGRLAEETGFTPTQIQMAWVLAQPFGFPCFPIVGARTPDQLRDSLGGLNCTLTPDMIRYLRPES